MCTDVRKERMLRGEQCVMGEGNFCSRTWQAIFLRKQAVNNREEGETKIITRLNVFFTLLLHNNTNQFINSMDNYS